MSFREDIEQRLVVDGVPFNVRLISNPTIDDVIVAEARLYASKIEGFPLPEERAVSRDIKDFLIRLGVER